MRAAALVLLSAAITGTACAPSRDPAITGPANATRQAFMACTIVEGHKLERSGEPAEAVATAAIAACGLQDANALEATRVESRNDALALELMRRLRRITHEGIVGDVVTTRAKRAAR